MKAIKMEFTQEEFSILMVVATVVQMGGPSADAMVTAKKVSISFNNGKMCIFAQGNGVGRFARIFRESIPTDPIKIEVCEELKKGVAEAKDEHGNSVNKELEALRAQFELQTAPMVH